MPTPIKLLVSVIVLIVAGVAYYLETRAGGGVTRWIALALGLLMVFAMWVFPEAKAKDVRREAARRR